MTLSDEEAAVAGPRRRFSSGARRQHSISSLRFSPSPRSRHRDVAAVTRSPWLAIVPAEVRNLDAEGNIRLAEAPARRERSSREPIDIGDRRASSVSAPERRH